MKFELAVPEALELVVGKVLEAIDLGSQMPIVLIDGRAGSGKSTFADSLQQSLFREGESLPRLIHMDDLYEGWDGLALGSDYLNRFILSPLSQGTRANWQIWDWAKSQRTDWREFSGGTPLIVEGCGSISARSSEEALIRIWLEASEETRRARWLEREGGDEMFDSWSAQELDFYAREKTKSLCDIVVSTD
ncbi:MAG: AAA family ATPase [Actinomycetota bacterium]